MNRLWSHVKSRSALVTGSFGALMSLLACNGATEANVAGSRPAAVAEKTGTSASALVAPLRIMPLGDSITWGFEGLAGTVLNYGGWRAPLWQALRGNHSVQFVGTNSNTSWPGDPAAMQAAGQSAQEGHSGWTSQGLASQIDSWLASTTPNIVLLNIGTNDLYQCLDWQTQTKPAMQSIYDRVLAAPATQRLYVATLIPIASTAVPQTSGGCVGRSNETINAMNANIKALVDTYRAQGKKITFVDMNRRAGLVDDDFSEGLHPNANGYEKMANVWLKAIQPSLRVHGDVDNNGSADIWWRHTANNQQLVYTLDGTAQTGTTWLPNSDSSNWEIEGTRDFDGDGQMDILWRNYADGRNLIYLMNGGSLTRVVDLPPIADANWHIAGTGDMNGDGRPDIVWNHWSSNETLGWIMDGTKFLRMQKLPTAAEPNWRVRAVADFNKDGHADFLWRNSSTGANVIWLLNGTDQRTGDARLEQVADPSWSIGGVADLNKDGSVDILWNNTNGTNLAWTMNGVTKIANVSLPGSVSGWHMVGPR